MKIIFAFIFPLMLSGCLFATAPVLPKFPEPPGQNVMEKCPDLAKIKEDGVTLLLLTITFSNHELIIFISKKNQVHSF